jgi:hypothetical protein
MTAIKTMMDRQSGSRGTAPVWALCVIDAALLVTSGVIHLHFWQIAYKDVHILGPLFLVQLIAAFVLALALVVTRHVLVVLAALGLMAGTIIGFILVRAGSLFGFHLGFTSSLAAFVLFVEIAAVLLLAATALVMLRPRAVR